MAGKSSGYAKQGGYDWGSGYDYRDSSWWKGFDWGAIENRVADRKKIRELKNKLTDEAAKLYIPLKVRVSPQYDIIQAFRGTRYIVNIPTNKLSKFDDKKNIAKLLQALPLLPKKSAKVHSNWVSAYIENNSMYLGDCRSSSDNCFLHVKNYFTGKETYEEVINYFSYTPTTDVSPNRGGESTGEFEGGKTVGRLEILTDLTTYTKALNQMTKKFIKQAYTSFTPSLRKGSKINRNYVNGTDYRPLMSKSVVTPKKASVLVVHDCSGSMDHAFKPDSPSHKAVSFIGALVNSGAVNVTHAVYHSEYGWKDMKKHIEKGEICHYVGYAEGFQYLDDNLPNEWVKEVDYVVITTDLEYSEEAEQGLYDYVSRAPAHMVLSFKNKGTLKGLNVRNVETVKDMVNAVITLTGGK